MDGVVCICGWDRVSGKHIWNIVHVVNEQCWTENAPLGHPSSDRKGLRGRTAATAWRLRLDRWLVSQWWRVPSIPYARSLCHYDVRDLVESACNIHCQQQRLLIHDCHWWLRLVRRSAALRPGRNPNWCAESSSFFFQVVHNWCVDDFFHYFRHDAKEGHRPVVSCLGTWMSLVGWHDVGNLPRLIDGWTPRVPETKGEKSRQW